MEIAQAMKIPWDQFRWYAAFHDESHHPHVHMVCYSADPSKGYLTKEGLAQMRSVLARDIFRQDLTEIYKRQTQRREDLVRESQTALRDAIRTPTRRRKSAAGVWLSAGNTADRPCGAFRLCAQGVDL